MNTDDLWRLDDERRRALPRLPRLIPQDMDVPDSRRDLSSKSNVAWLLRNLTVQNGDHPQIDATLEMLKRRYKRLAG